MEQTILGTSKPKQYSVNYFINNLILDEVDELNLKYRMEMVSRTFSELRAVTFDNLLSLIGLRINKMDTTFKKAIPVHELLAITLQLIPKYRTTVIHFYQC